jgi:hypothetical protein
LLALGDVAKRPQPGVSDVGQEPLAKAGLDPERTMN